MAWDDGSVHAVIDRYTNAAYDGDEFISALISSWKSGISQNLLPSAVELSASSDSAAVSYTLTSGDCEKIASSGGISILGYGVEISAAQIAN